MLHFLYTYLKSREGGCQDLVTRAQSLVGLGDWGMKLFSKDLTAFVFSENRLENDGKG